MKSNSDLFKPPKQKCKMTAQCKPKTDPCNPNKCLSYELHSPVHSAVWVTHFGTALFIFALKKIWLYYKNKKKWISCKKEKKVADPWVIVSCEAFRVPKYTHLRADIPGACARYAERNRERRQILQTHS